VPRAVSESRISSRSTGQEGNCVFVAMDIGRDLEEFLNEFGIFIEQSDEAKIYFKYRLFPTDDLKRKCHFDHENKMKFRDTFFEEIDPLTQHFCFETAAFSRERLWTDGKVDLVKQSSRNLNNGSCPSEHRSSAQKHENVPYLTYEFYRLNSEREDIYLDQLVIPQIEMLYEVATIKIQILDPNQMTEYIQTLFSLAHDISLENTSNLMWNKAYSENILESEHHQIFPMYSKVLYALQMSEYYQSYFKYSISDPVVVPFETRLNIISDPGNIAKPCYNRTWVWLMVYQIDYFQARLQHCVDKKAGVEEIRTIVEEKRKVIFDNSSIRLFPDEEDELVF
jgi:hypothetical protein